MKVLWVTNTIFPELAQKLGQNKPVSGGWMYGLAENLLKNDIELTIVTARPKVGPYETNVNGISYFLLKAQKEITHYDSTLEKQWIELIAKNTPDIIHIHGTEYGVGLALMLACPNQNYVVSIQGLISVCARYYTGHIPYTEVKKSITFRDFIKKDSILAAQKSFYKRGEAVEKKYFEVGRHFIGRTQWDFEHTLTLNRNACYHFCNESLRDSFYKAKKWNINTKTEHTIFLSQATYPLKGLHKVLEALKFLVGIFPDIKVRVAGNNIIKADSFKEKMALGGYASYIRQLIRKLRLQNHIEFTGPLNEEEMIREYLNCHVFICPSSIENSPNSLGEAQLLGVPSIASYVGGVPDMVINGETGILYRFEEVEMLAQAIKKVFTSDDFANKLSKSSMEVAAKRHDRESITKRTLEIYTSVITNDIQ